MSEEIKQKFYAIQMSSYVRPEITEYTSKDYVMNGVNNSFYNYTIDRYNGSPTNRAIIDSYAQFIYGKGLTSKQQASKPIQFATIISLLPKRDLKAVCQDYALFTEASIELIYKDGKLKSCKHVAKNQILPSKMDEDGDIKSYWFSQNWNKLNKNPPKEIKSWHFKGDKFKSGSLIYVISSYQVGKTYFTDPSYMAGMPYAELEEEIANYCINHIKNGLSFGHVWNMNNGEPESDDVKRQIVRDIKGNGTGSSNANRTYINWNDNKETAIDVQALEVSDAHQQYEFLSGEATQKLMIAHRVTSPIMFGVMKDGGLGNNANEMEVAFNESMINVIQPKKEVILDALMEIFTDAGFTIDLDFIPLREPAQPTATPTQLSAEVQETDDIIANELIALGESINPDEWELFDQRKQEGTPDITEFALQLAYVPANYDYKPSEQDTTLFKIRYQYAGSELPQRSFCAKMMGAGLVYRKEDIESASRKAVNAGFGPQGSNTYDLFLYKGGANCHHFWQRNIYLKANDERITTAKARELLNELEGSERRAADYEQNDTLVAKMPIDMPSNGYLDKKP